MDVTVYTTPTCGYCRMAKEYLKQRGVPFREIDISRDPPAAREVVDRTGQRGVPVIIIDGQTIIGFDRPRLEQILSQGQRPSFGATVADASKIASRPGAPLLLGAYVGKVRPDSAAERLGVISGDIIVDLNGQHIASADDLEKAVTRLSPGNRVSLVFLRGDRQLTNVGVF
ncbi:MAG: PDZ domain-containing protein [Chloroflexi bacterium]|nr:PDZ domain-containing protein [Chloroflexota bacterium]